MYPGGRVEYEFVTVVGWNENIPHILGGILICPDGVGYGYVPMLGEYEYVPVMEWNMNMSRWNI